MWRSYVICVLLGLLLVAAGGSVAAGAPGCCRPGGRRPAAPTPGRRRERPGQPAATARPAQSGRIRRRAAPGPTPRRTPAAPVPTVGRQRRRIETLLQQIEDQVAGLRGLQPKSPGAAALPGPGGPAALLRRPLQPGLSAQRTRVRPEAADARSGLLSPSDDVVQILLDVLQEQVIGVYNQDDKAMYLVRRQRPVRSRGKSDVRPRVHPRPAGPVLRPDHAGAQASRQRRPLAGHPGADRGRRGADAAAVGAAEPEPRTRSPSSARAAPSSKLFSAPAFLRDQLLFPYGDGFNFVRQIYQTAAATPRVDDVFRNPPDSTAQILHPEKYRSHETPVEVDLPDLSQGSLGDGWRKINSNVLGELDLRLILSQLTDSAHGDARLERLGRRPLGAARKGRPPGAGRSRPSGTPTTTRATSSHAFGLAMTEPLRRRQAGGSLGHAARR